MENQLSQTKPKNILADKKVKDCSENEIKVALLYLYALCGFEKMPDETQDMVLIAFIREHFSDLTIQDMKNAFQLGISGETGVNMKHYHNFNAIYFSDVINAYKTYQRSRKDLTPKLIEGDMSDQKKKETHVKWFYDLIFPQLENFFKGEIDNVTDHGNILYNYLDKRFINFSKERKDEIKEKARMELLDEFRVDKMAKPHDRNRIGKVITDILMGGKETDGLVRTRAKKIALNTFLAECKEMDREIIKEIKEHENL